MGEYTHLSMSDRCRFSVFLGMGLSMAEIAKRLQSIALRFIGRLSAIKEDEDYSSGIAQLKVEERAKQKRLSKNKPRWVST